MTGVTVAAAHLVQHHHSGAATPALGLAIIAALVWLLVARRSGGSR